jgi:hypothetical protein
VHVHGVRSPRARNRVGFETLPACGALFMSSQPLIARNLSQKARSENEPASGSAIKQPAAVFTWQQHL